MITAECQELTEQDGRAVLEVLEEASFRGESIEGIVHALDRRKNPPGIVEVRRAINWLVRRGLVMEDQEASLPGSTGRGGPRPMWRSRGLHDPEK